MDDHKNGVPGEEPRVMSREDVHDYRGITLSESGEEERREEPGRGGFHVHVFSPSAMPWWKKGLFWGAAAAVIALFLVAAWFFLVGGLVIAGLAAAAYALKRFLSRR